MKKMICFILSILTILSIVNVDILQINSSAEDNTSEYATVKVITNNIPEKIVEGAQTGADIKTKKESKTTLIKKDNKIYMSLNDICEFTRTHKEKADNKYILKQGLQEITVIIEDNGNSKLKSLYGDFNIQTVTENNKVYCEPEPIMSMLFADCTYYDNILLIDLPQYTVYEATSFDYSKYQSDILSYGIDENTDNMGTAFVKWGLSVQRMYVSFLSDIVVDANYGYFATDNTISQYYYEAFNEVLGYDIYSNKSVTEEETKIYEKINDLCSFLEKTQGGDISDTPFTDFYISSYIDSYAKKGLKDNNSLSVFNDTIRDLSTNGRVNEKLNSYLNQSGKDVLTNILFNSALEYVKRSSYDRKVLEMFKTLYSEDTVNKYNISLSENGQFLFQCARDYYDSCGSFDDIVKEVTIDESINKFSEMIIKGLFSITTAGKSQEVFETYETILTAKKLQEANSSFKPIEKINNSAKYFWLAKMQYTTVLTLDNINKKAGESLNSEDVKNLIANLDFYNRVSAVMIKTLADSYQLPTTTQREKDLVAHSDTYISDLCRNIYKLECCEYNLPTKEDFNNKNCDVFKNFFSNQEFESTENYDWHLAPTIEAEDIIVSDNSDGFYTITPYSKEIEKASDKYSIIKIDGKYSFIEYNGNMPIKEKYDKYNFFNAGEICLNMNNSYQVVWATDGHYEDNKAIINNYPDGWGRGASGGYTNFFYDSQNNTIWAEEMGILPFDGYISIYNTNIKKPVVFQQAIINNTEIEKGYLKYSDINTTGKYGVYYDNNIIIEPIYDDGFISLYNNIVVLQKDNQWCYFDGKTGKKLFDIPITLNSSKISVDGMPFPYAFCDGYVALYTNDGCGYYDTQGNEVIPCGTFEEVRPVHNGLAWVKKDGKWGVIKLKDIETETNIKPTDLTVNVDSTYIGELMKDNCTYYYKMNINEDSSLFTVHVTNSNGIDGGYDLPITKAENGIYFYNDGSSYDRNQITGARIHVINGLTGTITVNSDGSLLWKTEDSLPHELILTIMPNLDIEIQKEPKAFAQEQLNTIKKSLGVPDDLEVIIEQGNPSYWEIGAVWLTYVSVYYKDTIIASVNANSFTTEFVNEICMYSEQNLPTRTKAVLFTGTVNTEKDPLNVRKSPSVNAEIIGEIEKGSTVTVYSESGDWYEIEYNGGAGYVLKKYIKSKGNNSDTQISNISDNEILKAVNKYLEENKGHLGTWLTVSDAPYCPTEHMYSNDKKWSCPINLSWESYSANEIAGAYPHFAYVDKETLNCTLTANYETVVEFDLKAYIK